VTRLLLPPGQPLAEARRQLDRSRQLLPLPTGDAITAGSVPWSATASWASSNTKGAWTQVTSASVADAYGLIVFNSAATSASATDTSTVVDVGVGGSGSEVAIITDIAMGWRPSGFFENRIPVFVPAGSAISIRAAGVATSGSIPVVVVPLGRTFTGRRPSTSALSLNASGAKGTNLSVPGGANTKGAWTQLVASTTEPYAGLFIGVQGGADNVQPIANALVDIGVGASGSEVVVVPNVAAFSPTTSEQIVVVDNGPWYLDIPAGSRIAARYATSNTGMSLDVIVTGIR
jgi:hypothetical protein